MANGKQRLAFVRVGTHTSRGTGFADRLLPCHEQGLRFRPQGRVVRVEEASLFESAVQRGAAYAGTPWCLKFA
jgi:hypothetical protein